MGGGGRTVGRSEIPKGGGEVYCNSFSKMERVLLLLKFMLSIKVTKFVLIFKMDYIYYVKLCGLLRKPELYCQNSKNCGGRSEGLPCPPVPTPLGGRRMLFQARQNAKCGAALLTGL